MFGPERISFSGFTTAVNNWCLKIDNGGKVGVSPGTDIGLKVGVSCSIKMNTQ